LNSDGSRLFTHDFGPTAHIWDLASGEGLTISHDTELTDAVWNEDGSRVLTASWDRTARVWDAASGAELLTLLHEGTINHAIWNRDESRILTVSDDRTARVWDAETGDLLTILPHSAGVDQASWDRSESRILTVSNDGRATLFYVTLDDLVDAACGRARRNMTPLQWALFMGDEPYRATCPDLKTGLAQAQPTPSEGGTTSSADDSQPTSTSTTPTPEPTSTPVPTLPLELASFEDPAGVFGLSYPANFDQVEKITDRAHGFAFVASDGSGVATVFFDTLGEPLTDTEWQAFLDGGFADFAAEIGLDEDTVDVDVQVGGPGDHYLYLEFESETADAHGLMWVEEIDGIRAAAILGAPIDLWPEMQIALAESLDSFAWSAEALYAQSLVASALEPAESAPTEQPTDEAPMPTATAAATEAATSTATPEPESTATLEATPTPAPVALTGKIVFPVYDPNKPLQGQVGGYDVWVSDPQGNDRRLLVPNASQPDLSPDGDLLAYRSWDPSQRGIISAASSGGPGDLLTSFLEDGLPSWAPDAASMAFTSRREGDRASRLYRANGGERELGVLAEYVSTFPDGRLVIKGCTLQGECGLFITGADGGPLEPISNNTSDNAPAPSPDGGQIAFMSSRDGNWEIYLMGSSGGNVTRLTENAANDGLPAWSPDGRTIAFASDRDGVWAIWAMNADGSDQRKLFDMGGSPNGVVGYDVDNSKGWFEERISWAP
jgi:WD40 repeat protein